MIDPRRVAVLIRGSEAEPFDDRTAGVRSYRSNGDRILVTFNGGKTFPFGRKRVLLLENPYTVPLGPRARIEVDGAIWESAREAYYFTGPDRGWWHIVTGTGCSVRRDDQVRVIESGAADPVAATVLAYWRDLAAKLPEEGRALREGYGQLEFVHPDSALRRYLDRTPIEAVEHTLSPPVYPFHTNLSQRDAIGNALRNPISVIDGPPGTGKTQTILNLIANILVDESKTVAVVSSNNAAVDNVYEKLTEVGFGYVAANLGNSKKKDRFFADQGQRNKIVEELRGSPEQALPAARDLVEQDLRLQRLQDTERQLARFRSELDAYELERGHFMGYFDRQELPGSDRLPILKWSSKKILAFIADTDLANAPTGRITQVVDRIGNYVKYRAIRGADAQDVDTVLRLQRLYYDRKVGELERQIAGVSRSLKGADFDRLMQEHRERSAEWLKEQLRQRYMQRQPQEYDKKTYRRKWEQFSRDYPVILSTCHSLPYSIGSGQLVDYLIIDEASQVDLLAAGMALAFCRNLIVVGDMRQLKHIPGLPESEIPAAPAPVYDYQHHSILSSLIALHGGSLPRVPLREHYRCDPAIIGFCNQKFYEDDLIPFTRGARDYQPMVVVRTVEGNHMRQYQGGGRSNQREIDVIQQEVLPRFCDDISPEDIGITTPYRKQADKVTDALIETIEADTVHSFQGREKDAIVMTTVLDETWRGRTGLQFADDPQLVNVAVSRAKRRFVLVTNHDMLPKSRNLRDLIGYIGYHSLDEKVVDSEVISVFDLLYRDYSKRLRPLSARLRKVSKYPSEDIMRTVLEDLLREEDYRHLSFTQQVLVRNLLPDTGRLTPEQQKYVKNRASVDFVVFNRVTKQRVCAIEVDGFKYHEDNPVQLARDMLKDDICARYGIHLLRLPTTGSLEIERLRSTLDFVMDGQPAPNPAP